MNAEHAVAFLNALHPTVGPEAVVELRALRGDHTRRAWHYHPACTALEEMLTLNAQGWSVFVGVNPRRAVGRARKEDLGGVAALALDVDTKKTGIRVADVVSRCSVLRLSPNLVVNSGNGGHLYFLLDRLATVAAGEATGRRLRVWATTDNTWDSTRVMRLPGTVNWKTPPTACYLESLDTSRRYSLDEIDAALTAAGVPLPSPPRALPAGEAWTGALPGGLPAAVETMLRTGVLVAGFPSASEADWSICCALASVGLSASAIWSVYERLPVAQIKAAHAGGAYLERTIRRAVELHERRAASRELPRLKPMWEVIQGRQLWSRRSPPSYARPELKR